MVMRVSEDCDAERRYSVEELEKELEDLEAPQKKSGSGEPDGRRYSVVELEKELEVIEASETVPIAKTRVGGNAGSLSTLSAASTLGVGFHRCGEGSQASSCSGSDSEGHNVFGHSLKWRFVKSKFAARSAFSETVRKPLPSWSFRRLDESTFAPEAGSPSARSRNDNSPWSLRVSIVGAKHLPQLDVFGESDPYACVSLLLVQGWDRDSDPLLSVLDHDVSKTNKKEHTQRNRDATTHMLLPQRRTRVKKRCLNPLWKEVFHFDEARPIVIEGGKVTSVDGSASLKGQELVLMVTVHDHDYFSPDDFSGKLVLPIVPGLSDRNDHDMFNLDGSPLIGKIGLQAQCRIQADYDMDPLLKNPNTKIEVEKASNHRFDVCAASMQGWRTSMEDAHALVLNYEGKHDAFFAVFDGHGGGDVAEYASRHLHENLRCTAEFKRGDYEEALIKAMYITDCMLLSDDGMRECAQIRGDPIEAVSEQQMHIPSSGSTAVACLVVGKDVYCANLGDSRAVVCRIEKGWPTVVPLSEDQKPSNPEERDRVMAAGGTVENDRIDGVLAVARALGDAEFKMNEELPLSQQKVSSVPVVKKYTMKDGDEFLFLACDGIWDVYSSQQLVNKVHRCLETMDLNDTMKTLLNATISKHPSLNKGLGTDNMTCLIVDLRPRNARPVKASAKRDEHEITVA